MTEHTAFRRAATALVRLGQILQDAEEVRHMDPPRLASTDPRPSNAAETSNPTLKTVIDERRWSLSTATVQTVAFLDVVARALEQKCATLEARLDRWKNEEHDDDAV